MGLRLFSSLLFNSFFLANRTCVTKMSGYSVIKKGSQNTTDFKAYIHSPNGPISSFHDIPLFANSQQTILNMVVEIPRWTNAKMEISKEDKFNPIKQDVKKGKLRFVDNVFPYKGYIWNYGALPQTWENPNEIDSNTKCKGDNDPLDVIELGSKIHPLGSVVQVKPLGVLALIDEGETDWKIVTIDVTDPLAEKLNDINDVEIHMKGYLTATRDWFRLYKIPTGKPPNQFAFNGEYKNQDFARNVIKETHTHWQHLIGQVVDRRGISCENICVAGSPYLISREDAKAFVDAAPAFVPSNEHYAQTDVWHFVKA